MKEIEYPKKRSEAEIQALLWYFLRKKKIDARLQVVANRKKLDIVIFKDSRAVCIVECKSWSKNYSLVRRYRLNNSKQVNRYREMFGLPVIVCGRIQDITKVQGEIIKLTY